MISTALVAASMIGVAMTGSASAGDISSSMLADTCNGCHGPDGSTYGPATPSIAGVNELYLTETMMAYKAGSRDSTIMTRIAKGYTDDEIKAIAKYFSKKPLVRRVEQKTDATLAAKGQEISRKLCEGCHEKDGYSAIDYPALAGQPTPYLNYQLSDFMSGARDLDKIESMSAKERKKKKRNLEELKGTAQGLESVVNFYGSRK